MGFIKHSTTKLDLIGEEVPDWLEKPEKKEVSAEQEETEEEKEDQ